jgi:hypothetical protein
VPDDPWVYLEVQLIPLVEENIDIVFVESNTTDTHKFNVEAKVIDKAVELEGPNVLRPLQVTPPSNDL